MLAPERKRVYKMGQESGMGGVWDFLWLLWHPYSTKHWVDTHVFNLYLMFDTYTRNINTYARDCLLLGWTLSEFHIQSITMWNKNASFMVTSAEWLRSCVKIFPRCLTLSSQAKSVPCKVIFNVCSTKLSLVMLWGKAQTLIRCASDSLKQLITDL